MAANPGKWMVQATDRTALGHPGAWRAGTFFPSNSATEVEVVDQDEDPPKDPAKDQPGVMRVGRKTWEAIQADKVLSKWPAGDDTKGARTSEDPGELRRMVETLTQENNRLKGRVAELEGQGQQAAAQPQHQPGGEAERHHRRRGASE